MKKNRWPVLLIITAEAGKQYLFYVGFNKHSPTLYIKPCLHVTDKYPPKVTEMTSPWNLSIRTEDGWSDIEGYPTEPFI